MRPRKSLFEKRRTHRHEYDHRHLPSRLAHGRLHEQHQRQTPEEDTSVRELLRGSDCAVSIFGIGFRTPSVERAKLEGYPIQDPDGSSSSISKIRRIEFTDDSFFLGINHCVAVVGE